MLNHQTATQLVEFPLLSKFWSCWQMWLMKLPQGQGFCCNICHGNVRCGLAAPTAYVGVVLGASPQYMVHNSGYIWTKKNTCPVGVESTGMYRHQIHWSKNPSAKQLWMCHGTRHQFKLVVGWKCTLLVMHPFFHDNRTCCCVYSIQRPNVESIETYQKKLSQKQDIQFPSFFPPSPCIMTPFKYI